MNSIITAKDILLELLKLCKKNELIVNESVKNIASYCNLSERCIRHHIKSLEKLEIIKIIPNNKNKKSLTNTYIILEKYKDFIYNKNTIKCKKCNIYKEESEFYNCGNNNRTTCISCEKEYRKKNSKCYKEKISIDSEKNKYRKIEYEKRYYNNNIKQQFDISQWKLTDDNNIESIDYESYENYIEKLKMISKKIIQNSESRAKQKGIEHNLKMEDVIIPEKCPVLNIILMPGKGIHHKYSPSLDRLDSTKGYIKDNINVISHRANTLKSDATFEEFEAIYKWWKAELKKRKKKTCPNTTSE